MKKWLTKNLIGFSLASFFNDFCHEMTTALLPSFINQIVPGTNAPFILGAIQGIADAAATIMRLISGWLADRVPSYKPFLIVGYGLTSIVGLIGIATTAWSVLFYKTVAWMSRGIREPMRDTWISKIVSQHYYGRAFGFQRAADTLGALLGPLCGFILLQYKVPIRSIFLIACIPGILSMLPIIFLTHETKKQSSKNISKNLFTSLKELPSKFNHFLLVMLLFGMANFNQTLLLYRFQTVSSQPSSIIATSWALIFYTIFNFIRAISEFGIGTLSDYYNRKYLLIILGFGFFSLTCLGCLFEATNLLYWVFIFSLSGISAGTVKTLEKAYAATLLPELVRGTGFGTLQAIDGIGDLLSSIIVGGLWSYASPEIGFLYALLLSFIAMTVFFKKK